MYCVNSLLDSLQLAPFPDLTKRLLIPPIGFGRGGVRLPPTCIRAVGLSAARQ